MQKALPKFHETFFPILKTLEKTNEIKTAKLLRLVADNYYLDLPSALLEQKTKSGANTLFDRIGWGKSYLVLGKFLENPKKGFIRITKKGKKTLNKKSFSLFDLKQDIDFQNHEKTKSYKKQQHSKTDQKTNQAIKENDKNIENFSPTELIEQGISQINNQVQINLLEILKKLEPFLFEKIVLEVLKKMGYGDYKETSKTKDGGIDGIVNQDKLGLEKIYIQSKRYDKNKITEVEIRNFIGAMSGDTNKGIFVTTSSFAQNAIEKANNAHHKIILVDGEKLITLMMQYNVGVYDKQTYKEKSIDSDFFEAF